MKGIDQFTVGQIAYTRMFNNGTSGPVVKGKIHKVESNKVEFMADGHRISKKYKTTEFNQLHPNPYSAEGLPSIMAMGTLSKDGTVALISPYGTLFHRKTDVKEPSEYWQVFQNRDIICLPATKREFEYWENFEKYIKDEFYFDTDGSDAKIVTFDGYNLPSDLWNGWSKPLMTKQQADVFVKNNNALPHNEVDHFKWVREDGLWILQVIPFNDLPYLIQPWTIVYKGKSKLVYDMSMGLIWEAKSTDED